MISVDCPKCGKHLKADDTASGRKIRCPACAAITFVQAPAGDSKPDCDAAATVPPAAPAPTSEQTTVPPAPADAAATVPPAAGPREPTEDDTLVRQEDVGGAVVPGYEILGELGRGGMGVVYKARHLQLGWTVALKMILSGGHAGEADLARFRTEAEAIARLQHPNFVQIYEVGEHAGLPFFSLEFCDGGSLEKKLAGTPLPPKEAAALVETLARAMDAAHHKGIIHRDLKPANVLLAVVSGQWPAKIRTGVNLLSLH